MRKVQKKGKEKLLSGIKRVSTTEDAQGSRSQTGSNIKLYKKVTNELLF
jgi:hypothetical protein